MIIMMTRQSIPSDLRRINEKLAVELLEKLILFIGTSRHENFKPNNSASLENVGAVVISRQLDLRYVCLLWHNIVHRLARLGLAYWSDDCDGEFLLYNHALSVQHLSKIRVDTVSLKSCVSPTKAKRTGTWLTLADRIQSLSVSVCNSQNNDKSILFALRNATKGIYHPCELSLDLHEYEKAVGSLVRDPYADFEKEYPTLTLRSLSLDFPRSSSAALNEAQFTKVKECANYLFSIGQQTLSRADVQLSALDGLPEEWVCETLKELNLNLKPLGYRRNGGWSAAKMLLEFDKQARIPRLFPRLEEITLRCSDLPHLDLDWPHLDLACLNQLTHLRTLVVFASLRKTADLRSNWRLAALPHVETLRLVCYDGIFPISLCEFVPNVRKLKVDAKYAGACVDLLSEIGVAGIGCVHLKHLSIEYDSVSQVEEISPRGDVITLFAGLHQLPALTCLEFALTNDDCVKWCRPGDLGLLHVLPPQLSSVSLSYCFLPSAVAPDAEELSFLYDLVVGNAEELIYKSWFLLVIHRLCDFPKLERFDCKIVAPSFHAAVSLAAKWSKSSSAAIADLGLALVINVTCSTDAYLSFESGQTCNYGDTLKFRFTLASRPDFPDKKFSTRMFTFELEYPYPDE